MLKILLLEDDPEDAELISRLFRTADQVSRVSTREQFEEALDADRWDVILADFTLPGFDGMSALKMAREKRPEVPFIFVSGTVAEECAIEALKLGAADYLMKDRMARLPSAVERACQEKRLEAQLLASQRLEAVGALAAGMAHDLNNLLSPMLVAIALVRPSVDSDKQRVLDIAQSSLKRAAEMLRQMLIFLRGINGERRPLDVMALVQQLVEFLRLYLPKNIEVRHHVQVPVPHVLGNSTQLHQVLLNFCINSRDAMPGGGVLDIGASAIELTRYRPATAHEPLSGRFLQIVVSDDGCGMSPQTVAHLFEPFFSTKEVGKGTGLGLATSLRIVKAHGGHIDVHTHLNRGSSFCLLLPAETANEGPPNLPRGNGRTVLLVDDEVGLLEILKAVLEQANYRVLSAANGAEALGLYKANADAVFAVLTDLEMPILNGAKLVGHLRQLSPEIKLVLLTGDGHGAEASALRPHAVLQKPFTPEQLLNTLQAMAADVHQAPEPAQTTIP